MDDVSVVPISKTIEAHADELDVWLVTMAVPVAIQCVCVLKRIQADEERCSGLHKTIGQRQHSKTPTKTFVHVVTKQPLAERHPVLDVVYLRHVDRMNRKRRISV